ncbi:MAG: hypothetical protein E6Q97_20190 [Desulfurellales bacterium]|nr:MAG: hypothetical protein E6Q97_20190 [Desulfurellales bacterium]
MQTKRTTPGPRLTPRRLEVLREFYRRETRNEAPPTLRELCNLFEHASTTTYFEALRALETLGYLARTQLRSGRQSRAYRLTAAGRRVSGADLPLYAALDVLRERLNARGAVPLAPALEREVCAQLQRITLLVGGARRKRARE